MALVRVGIGSSSERERNIRLALDALSSIYEGFRWSPVYEAESVGFDGEPFLNLVAEFETVQGPGELQACFKTLEAQSGRTGQECKWSGRTLDIDLLTWDDAQGLIDGIQLPRGEILEVAYVLQPLADLAPDDCHPQTGQTYAWHWQHFQGSRKLHPYVFDWR